jgi:hypothetical protein
MVEIVQKSLRATWQKQASLSSIEFWYENWCKIVPMGTPTGPETLPYYPSKCNIVPAWQQDVQATSGKKRPRDFQGEDIVLSFWHGLPYMFYILALIFRTLSP